MTSYHLPDDTYRDWDRHQHRGFRPTPRQRLVMDAVQTALDAGLFYTDEVQARCAEILQPSSEEMQKRTKRVVGGDFGMDCYYARGALDAIEKYRKIDEADEQINPEPGLVVGSVIFNDFKLITRFTVEEVGEHGLNFTGKRGAQRVTGTCNALQLRHAIERAHERGNRKQSFEVFVKTRQGVPA